MATRKKVVKKTPLEFKEPEIDKNETKEDFGQSKNKKFASNNNDDDDSNEIEEVDEENNIFNDYYTKSMTKNIGLSHNSSLPGNIFKPMSTNSTMKKLSREDDIKQKMKNRRLGVQDTLTKSASYAKDFKIKTKSSFQHQDSESKLLTKSVSKRKYNNETTVERNAQGKKQADFNSLTQQDEDHSHFKKKKRITIMPTLKPQAHKDKGIIFDLSDEESIIIQEDPGEKHEHKDGDLTTIKSVDTKKFRQYDFIFPGENIARFCKFTTPEELTDEDVSDVIDDFSDFKNPQPVIVLSGARNSDRKNLLIAISRIARRTDAVIIDSGVESGIENACENLEVKLAGVFPENQVTMPKVGATVKPATDLTAGHSHLFMIPKNEETGDYENWGSESRIRFMIADAISKGDRESIEKKFNKCKIVVVCMGDDVSCQQDLHFANKNDLPCIIVKGSAVTDKIIDFMREQKPLHNDQIEGIISSGHCYALPNNNSEDLQAMIHFFLTVTPW